MPPPPSLNTDMVRGRKQAQWAPTSQEILGKCPLKPQHQAHPPPSTRKNTAGDRLEQGQSEANVQTRDLTPPALGHGRRWLPASYSEHQGLRSNLTLPRPGSVQNGGHK